MARAPHWLFRRWVLSWPMARVSSQRQVPWLDALSGCAETLLLLNTLGEITLDQSLSEVADEKLLILGMHADVRIQLDTGTKPTDKNCINLGT